jgi:hypothetical protein
MSGPTSSFLANMLWARTNSHSVSQRALNARNLHRCLNCHGTLIGPGFSNT